MTQLLDQLSSIESEATRLIATIKNDEDLKVIRSKFLGKKGVVTDLLKSLGSLSAEERPVAGSKINTLKGCLSERFDSVEAELKCKGIDKALCEAVDITWPGRSLFEPKPSHPVSQIMTRMQEIFMGLGFSVYEGPEVETDHYNFEALNVPKDHPARDMQDTFYLKEKGKGDGGELLLRTHTSPMQIHVMETVKPPIKAIFPGAVYRRDADITHSPMFHQVEGLVIDEHITMAHLKGALTEFLHQMFGGEFGVRFRPSFFPFTEPSAEVDIQCMMCRGKKRLADGTHCRICKQTGWIEILGCGMVHPAVFKAVGLDPKKFSGFAFGMGVERITMLKFGISDIRLLFENDVRFLKQF